MGKHAIRHKAYDTGVRASSGAFRRGVVAWIGLILLTFNVVAGGALPAGASGTSQPLFAQDLFGDRIVICTSTGMVVMDRDGNLVEADHGVGQTDLCVFCLPLVGGTLHVPAQTAVVAVRVVSTRPAGVYGIALSAAHKPSGLTGASSSRGPPVA